MGGQYSTSPSAMDNCIDIDPDPAEYAMGDCSSKEPIEQEIQERLSPEESLPEISAPEEFVQNVVRDNRIVVFSKSHCPHCDHSKMLLSNLGVEFTAVELDQMKEGTQVQSTLGQITDARTVPRIFIDGKCVGGNSDLQNLNQTGELTDRLKSGNMSTLQ